MLLENLLSEIPSLLIAYFSCMLAEKMKNRILSSSRYMRDVVTRITVNRVKPRCFNACFCLMR